MKQTAVEWLANEFNKESLIDLTQKTTMYLIVQQAKEMERQKQEKLAFEYFKAGQNSMEEGGKSFDQYYNETFKK